MTRIKGIYTDISVDIRSIRVIRVPFSLLYTQYFPSPYIYSMSEQDNNVYEQGQVLLINKPLHWTSFDAVRKIRNLIKVKKVGHAGTLDPLATGLLILCTGKFTKKINEYMTQEKEYTGTFTLGSTTPTYDLESKPGNFKSFENISEENISDVVKKFIGEIMQIPPAHSAIKLEGKRVYELARKGKEVKLEPRKIFISEFVVIKIELPVVHFKIVCSTGTYIRSLANDFGTALGCGAYLSSLCRTRIGNFKLEDAMSIEEFEKKLQAASI
jgi:tRNA pseudouridine55 synthase